MPHTYARVLIHCVFSTKEHKKSILPEMQPRLWEYLSGIARQNGAHAICIGGVEDHVHLLLSLPATISISKLMQLIKGGSSKWVHETYPNNRTFEWQQGFGAFSLGVSQIEQTIAYIEGQAEHHQKVDFRTEFIAFLKKHGVKYDERYVMG